MALAKPTAPPKNAASAAAAQAVPPTGVGIKPPPAQRVAAARPVTLPPRAAPTLPEAPLPPRAAPTLPPWPTSAAAGVATAPAVVTTVAAPRSVPSSAPAAIPLPAPAVPPAAAAPRDHAARASELISNQLPRLAQRAERLVLRVLVAAADSEDEDDLRSAARAIRLAPGDSQLEPGAAPAEARALNEAARTAFWRRGDLQTAVALQTRAFGANPLDAEVAGNLAFLRLKQQPQQPEAARQLALHALTTHDPRFPHGRIEDWTTLAITNSLTGRERDARNAWLVTLELAPQPERQCRAAVNAYAAYGERVRPAVEAMLFRAHSAQSAHRGSERSALCEWPPHWGAGASARR